MGRAPEFMLKSGLPLQSDFRCWAMCGGDLLESNTTPVSLDGDIINPTLHCQYPSSIWTGMGNPVYDESLFPSSRVFQTTMGWEQWTP